VERGEEWLMSYMLCVATEWMRLSGTAGMPGIESGDEWDGEESRW